jgi:Flp pilus assembly protein TadD
MADIIIRPDDTHAAAGAASTDEATASKASATQRRCIDFLYWHAVSKMRIGEFRDAEAVFRLVFQLRPQRTDAGLGEAYCLARLGRLDDAASLIGDLRRRPLAAAEGRLLGRLHRRCEFERSRARLRQRELDRRQTVASGLPRAHAPG